MKLLKIFKKTASVSYTDLPAKEKKKIIKEAIGKANKEQFDMVKIYRNNKCHASN